MAQEFFFRPILDHLVNEDMLCDEDKASKLPSIGTLAKELGISHGKLREDLLAAQAYGMVELRPGDGTYIRPFDFYAAIRPAVIYGIACDKHNFDKFYRLRAQVEVGFLEEAAKKLQPEDFEKLHKITRRAETKLNSQPIEIPHREHRIFHMLVFSRLNNPFVLGLLQAYWDGYETVELHRYFDISYYEQMWDYHKQIVSLLQSGDYQQSRKVLVDHFGILETRLHITE
ncbi:MAG: FCD domain-containing protein [Anaerolineae bacterium]|nr:FCD domain-containing protein [Anaerolineae bacterium]